MTWAIAAFELRKRLRMISTYVYFGMFFTFAFLAMIAAAGAFKSVAVVLGEGGKVFANSPYNINGLTSFLSYLAVIVVGAISGRAVLQDVDANCEPFFFTAPIHKRHYLGGRFLGALLTLTAVFASLGLGLWLGSKMPFVQKDMIGPNHLMSYVQPYLITVLPNFLFMGVLFFGLATATRKMAPVYVATVVLLVGYLIAQTLANKIEYRHLLALADPFGLSAMGELTRYWSIAERNQHYVPLTGVFLENRILWVAVSLALAVVVYARFRFEHQSGAEGRTAAVAEDGKAAETAVPTTGALQASGTLEVFHLTALHLRETVKNVYFLVIALAGVMFLIFASLSMGAIYGTDTYPVTYQMLGLAKSFGLFTLILIIFYSGELVWRERDAKVDQLMDALPVPSWVPFVSKLAALMLVQVVLMALVTATCIGIQASKGYFHFELGLYAKELFGLGLVHLWLLCALAFAVQVVVNNKYLGHLVMVVYFVANAFLSELGIEHHLVKFASAPEGVYSAMNGFGPFLRPQLWFDLYWAGVAVLLIAGSFVLWPRGLVGAARERLRVGRERWNPRLSGLAAAALFVVLGAGSFIFYNTNLLNHYRTSADEQALSVRLERTYKRIESTPQPRIVSTTVALDINPRQRRLVVNGSHQLVNKTGAAITTVMLRLPRDLEHPRLSLDELEPTHRDPELGVYLVDLPKPWAPGEARKLAFSYAVQARGFRNSDEPTAIAQNGTFFHNSVLPGIGYEAGDELSEDEVRKKYGLKPKERMASIHDQAARRNNYISVDADWMTLDATLSTDPDQLAFAPGKLAGEWTANGRRYFHYVSDSKVVNLHGFLSARYAVKKDRWRDVDLEIDYQPGHEFDLPQMMDGMKDALEYCSTNFAPFPHRQMRIVEFPRYATYAQSFPNTIPYSEGIGFIARVDPKDPDDVDYPFYVTAHEVAHQWWGHQVAGANVQGATVTSETMAQYTALMVMKHRFGEHQMRRFLRYELDRYLMGRATERKKELPLELAEDQGYIHYNKGSLAMYLLQDQVGEENVNRALHGYLQRVAYQEPPYTTSLELVDALAKATPADRQYLIHDLFETITLFDNRAESAIAVRRPDGQYEVTVKVLAQKSVADGLGNQKPEPFSEWIDVGALDARGEPIALQQQRVHEGESTFTLLTKIKPAKAGIDPLNKLVDRDPDDNVVAVH